MASATLYPPMIPNSVAAFNGSNLKIPYTLSPISTNTDPIVGVQVSIVKQDTNQSVVNKNTTNTDKKVISNILFINKIEKDNEGYYVTINEEDVIKEESEFGWIVGQIYKIQIRLSTIAVPMDETATPQWVVNNANKFSEWTTYCTTKYVNDKKIVSTCFGISGGERKYYSDTFVYEGYMDNVNNNAKEDNEILYKYSFSLKGFLSETSGKTLENTEEIYSNYYSNKNKIIYTFNTLLSTKYNHYRLQIVIETQNGYKKTISQKFYYTKNEESEDIHDVYLVSFDNIADELIENEEFKYNLFNSTSIDEEESSGRIGLRFYNLSNPPRPEVTTKVTEYKYYIRRTDSKSNFKEWVDIATVTVPFEGINYLDYTFWDNTAESGIWYKYGAQLITKKSDGTEQRGLTKYLNEPIIRDFENSYLYDGQHLLKLMYNTNLSSYTYNISETKMDTIGSKYPFIVKTGNMNYRTFSINSLISFNSDENNSFITDEELFGNAEIAKLYKQRNLGLYDSKKEQAFREKVLDFLQNGKPKLFKSAAEGNILVYLMGINFSGEQVLNRLVGTVSATANEIDENTYSNYKKYGFINSDNITVDKKYYPEGKKEIPWYAIPQRVVTKIENLGTETTELEKSAIATINNIMVVNFKEVTG